MRRCVNCGKPLTAKGIRRPAAPLPGIFAGFTLCQACEDDGDRLADMLRAGLTLEYVDGTKETLKLDP
jgi:hypothetical protein